jgi:hypothetical protein
VSAVLERHKGNVVKAAAAAGLSRKHFYELLGRIEAGEGAEGAEGADLHGNGKAAQAVDAAG